MKLKNLTQRNINILSKHNGGVPFTVTIPALSTLELSKEEAVGVGKSVVKTLVSSKVLEITEALVSELTNEEIIAKVEAETGVTLPKKSNKANLQNKAELLGVEV